MLPRMLSIAKAPLPTISDSTTTLFSLLWNLRLPSISFEVLVCGQSDATSSMALSALYSSLQTWILRAQRHP